MANDILVDPLGLILIILTIMAGFIGSFTLVWRVSKNYNEQKLELKVLSEQIVNVKTELTSYAKDQVNLADKLRAERNAEIQKALLNQHEKFEVIQKQVDSLKADVKSVGSRVDVVNTRVEGHVTELAKVNGRIDKVQDFFTDWIQRVENRIEEARKIWDQNLADAKKELMGMMNMLINLISGLTGRSLTGK